MASSSGPQGRKTGVRLGVQRPEAPVGVSPLEGVQKQGETGRYPYYQPSKNLEGPPPHAGPSLLFYASPPRISVRTPRRFVRTTYEGVLLRIQRVPSSERTSVMRDG